jgi:hypothetical protein
LRLPLITKLWIIMRSLADLIITGEKTCRS